MFMLLDCLTYHPILERLMTVMLKSQLQVLAMWDVFSQVDSPPDAFWTASCLCYFPGAVQFHLMVR